MQNFDSLPTVYTNQGFYNDPDIQGQNEGQVNDDLTKINVGQGQEVILRNKVKVIVEAKLTTPSMEGDIAVGQSDGNFF